MGDGLFADQFIVKDTLLWKYVKGVNVRAFKGQKQTKDFLATLKSDDERKNWLVHMYHDQGYCN